MIKTIVKEAIKEFLTEEEGRKIFIDLINDALVYEVKGERTLPDGRTEIYSEDRHALAAMLEYLSGVEAAIRGCQVDAAAARNRAAQTRDMLVNISNEINDRMKIEDLKQRARIECHEK